MILDHVLHDATGRVLFDRVSASGAGDDQDPGGKPIDNPGDPPVKEPDPDPRRPGGPGAPIEDPRPKPPRHESSGLVA